MFVAILAQKKSSGLGQLRTPPSRYPFTTKTMTVMRSSKSVIAAGSLTYSQQHQLSSPSDEDLSQRVISVIEFELLSSRVITDAYNPH